MAHGQEPTQKNICCKCSERAGQGWRGAGYGLAAGTVLTGLACLGYVLGATTPDSSERTTTLSTLGAVGGGVTALLTGIGASAGYCCGCGCRLNRNEKAAIVDGTTSLLQGIVEGASRIHPPPPPPLPPSIAPPPSNPPAGLRKGVSSLSRSWN
jgi:hypothetical protein